MKYALTSLVSAAAIFAFSFAMPATAGTGAPTSSSVSPSASGVSTGQAGASTGTVGNGNDANAEAEQAQLHPTEMNQYPDRVPNGVPQGEVYYSGRGYRLITP